MKDTIRVLIALVVALAGGIAIAVSGNTALVHGVDRIAPIGLLWVNAIRMTVIPLVVSLLITGVASVADLKSIGRIGSRTLLVFVSLLAGTALIAMPIARFVFGLLPPSFAGRPPLPPGSVEAAGQLGATGADTSFGAFLVSLIPANPVAAAANGAMLPLIIFALLFSLALTRCPLDARQQIVRLFEATRDAMLVLVRW